MNPTAQPTPGYTLTCTMHAEAAALERLCQVIRVRGFRVARMAVESAGDMLDITLTLEGSRPDRHAQGADREAAYGGRGDPGHTQGHPAQNRLTGGRYQALYGKNFPFMVITTRSPLGFSSFSTSMVKSMALMMPSPNFSWISCLRVSPYTPTTSYRR